MRKLLSASFRRLRFSGVLRLCVLGALAMSMFFLIMLKTGEGDAFTTDEIVMNTLPFLCLLQAAYISLFLGTEYQDGTIRNKVIAGHSRQTIYGSFLVTALAGSFLILLGWALGGIVGIIRFGWFTSPITQLVLYALQILALTAANAALLTLIGILVQSQAKSAVLSILLMLLLIVAGSVMYNSLNEPETISEAVITANGIEIGESQPNPSYISGTLRRIYQFAVNTLPSGQAILLANREVANPIFSTLASVCITFIASFLGVEIFKKERLK